MRPPRGRPGGRPLPAAAGAQKGPLSLARALSKFGVCSRSEAKRRILEGRVELNGAVCRSPELRIDARRDRVRVDGVPASDHVARVVIALHKPTGCVTTRHDPAGRPTVYDLLGDHEGYVFPVGRLDQDSSGLLVFTNDHRLGHRLTDPGHHVPKAYHVRVQGVPSDEALAALRRGVVLPPENVATKPARVKVLGARREGGTWLEIVLGEGRNRQVRRMCSAVGHEVEELVRVRIGALDLAGLAPGEWRTLAPEEIPLLERR
jgi:23S rRNA pseudouridine2605 synthase